MKPPPDLKKSVSADPIKPIHISIPGSGVRARVLDKADPQNRSDGMHLYRKQRKKVERG